jgi:predicted MFS family arabinose efflux permease
VEALVPPRSQGRALAAISSGTGYGVAVAGPIAVAVGSAWRSAWLVFAALAVCASVWAVSSLPSGTATSRGSVPRLHPRWFVCPRSRALLLGALFVGLGSSVYWTFAVDYLVRDGSVSTSASRVFLGAVGIASVAGTFGGDLVKQFDARLAFRAVSVTLGASLVLLAFAPGSLVLAGLSAIVFGCAYNLAVAIQGIWSLRVFSARPSAGLAAVMFMLALGLLLGPLLAGLADRYVAMQSVFLGAVVVIGLAALCAPEEPLAPAGVAPSPAEGLPYPSG